MDWAYPSLASIYSLISEIFILVLEQPLRANKMYESLLPVLYQGL